MSEIKLVVRDELRDATLICHGSDAHRVVAALSADPVTFDELETALQRFMAVDTHDFFRVANDSVDDEPRDSGLVVIDLAARFIVVRSSYFSASRSGQVFYHNGEACTAIPVDYSLANEWEITDDVSHWRQVVDARRSERRGIAKIDLRAVLYGRPLLEFLARECCEAIRHVGENQLRGDSVVDRSIGATYEALKDIHARWLMTPCASLENKIPRDVLLTHRERLAEDMQQRCVQWARTQECPCGLDVTSHAFQFGGFGTHELVKYFDLVRELLWSCWIQLTELARPNGDSIKKIELADFVTSEVPRLEHVRDEWLNTPDPDCHLRTPQSIIDRERARLPEALFGRDAMIDPDCPCCQMLAELPGPTFMHLDASGMDWEFPFDIYCRTREEWDAQQAEYASFKESDNGCGPFGIPRHELDSAPSVWTRSFSIAESTDLPLGVRLLGIAWHVAELVMELNELTDVGSSTEQLNRDFRALREIIATSGSSSVETCIEHVIAQFDQTLGDIAGRHPTLEPRCSDLARKINSLRQ